MYKHILLIALILTFALPVMAQWGSEPMMAVAPSVAFRSTGTLASSGSMYASAPTINAYGQGEGSSFASSLRGVGLRDGGGSGGSGVPSTPGDSGNQQPVGDAVLPLLLMVAMYVLIRLRRQRVES